MRRGRRWLKDEGFHFLLAPGFRHHGGLMTHVVPAGSSEPHSFWIDHDRTAGRVWNDDIKDKIANPDLFVLPGSANFTAGTYIHDHEWPAMERLTRQLAKA
jgi:hypothetical protein